MFSANNAATVLQKYIRARESRIQYSVKTLPISQLTDYRAFILGNDPEITGLEKFSTTERMALIATSGLRSVKLICQLAEDSKYTPKLIIIDNSMFVHEFWKNIKSYFSSHQSEGEFFNDIENFLKRNQKVCRTLVSIDEVSEINNFFLDLFKKYFFQRIFKIIQTSIILRQGWEDKDTLMKVKNILTRIGINHVYMYPSNIVAYCHFNSPDIAEKILENIAMVNPKLCIHTDMVFHRAVNFFLVDTHEPESIKSLIFSNKKSKNKSKIDILNFLINSLNGNVNLVPNLKFNRELERFEKNCDLEEYLIIHCDDCLIQSKLIKSIIKNKDMYKKLISNHHELLNIAFPFVQDRNNLILPLLENDAEFERVINSNTAFLSICEAFPEMSQRLFEKMISHYAHIFRLIGSALQLVQVLKAFPEHADRIARLILSDDLLYFRIIKNENDLFELEGLFSDEYARKINQRFNLPRGRSSFIHIPSNTIYCFFNQRSPHEILLEEMKKLLSSMRIQGETLLTRIKEKDYGRALRIAANHQNGLPMVDLLLDFKRELKIQINEQAGDEKNAAIHYAARRKNKKMYDLLLSHGADPTVANQSNLRPCEILGVKCNHLS